MCLVFLSFLGVEDFLAHTDGLGRHFDKLVGIDVVETILQGHPPRRLQDDGDVLVRASLVSQRLALDDVDSKVAVIFVLPDDHALIDIDTGADEHRASFFGILQGIGGRISAIRRHKDAKASLPDRLADLGAEFAEGVVDDAVPLGGGHKGIHERNEASRRNHVDKTGLSILAGHADRLGATAADKLHNGAGIFVRDIDLQILERLAFDAVYLLGDNRRLGDLKLEAFPAHRFDQDGKMEFSSSSDDEGLAPGIDGEAERNILLGFLVETIFDLLRGEDLALSSREGGRVGTESHPHRRLVDSKRRQGFKLVVWADCLADHDVGKAGDAADVSPLDFLGFDAVQSVECEKLGDLEFRRLAVEPDARDFLSKAKSAAVDTSDPDPAHVLVVVQKRRLELKRGSNVGLRGRDGLDDRLEERIHAFLLRVDVLVQRGGHVQRGSIDDREFELVVIGTEVHEEFEDLVQRPLGIRTGPVDLVDDDDRLQVIGDRLLEDETRLRHRAIEGIDKKTDAVDHIHDPFDLARKIRMPGSVDDVDLIPLVVDASRLGKDGDSSFVLERIGIHAAGGDLFVFAESPARLEHGIDKSGLAVIDVGDDGDVSDFVVHNEYLLHKKDTKNTESII